MVLQDEKARKKIASQLDTNFLVEAGAGSGKTASLVKRMVNLVVHKRCKVEEMAAITFTRKAAAELRGRFQDKLEQKLAAATNPQTSQVLSEALMNLDRSFVGTIHAFCAKLLRERPVEAGIDPGFSELDDVQNSLLMDRAWQEYLLEIKSSQPGLLERVEQIGISPEELKDLFHRFSEYPEVDVSAESVCTPSFRDALAALHDLLQEACSCIPDPPHEDRHDKLQESILKARRMFNNQDLGQHANAIKVLSLFEKTPDLTLKLWLNKDDAKSIKATFEQFSSSRAAPLLQAWKEYCHYHVAAFLLPGREFLSDFKDKHAVLGFHDLLMKGARMLREFPEVRSYFKDKYRCLLVDEFQDTDPLQSEMMFCLTGSDLHQKNWQKLAPEPGSLFVVGDPKQSIYRFRRADIDTYNQVKRLIIESGGEILLLTTNFRCLKPLEEYSNQIFNLLLSQQENKYQAQFSPIDAWRTDVGDTHSGVKILEVAATFTKKEEIVGQDARQVAAFVRHALNGAVRLARSPEEKRNGLSETPQPGDFLIILSYKDMMETYARALEGQGVPVSMTGGSSLSESLELSELLKLLKYLDDPHNQVLLVAVLKGLFFGISDAGLYRFKVGGGRFNPLDFLPEGMDGMTRQLFADAFARLRTYLNWKRTEPPAVVLEKLIGELGLVPFALSQPLGERTCSYLYQIVEYLRQGKAGCGDPFQQMVKELERLFSSGVEEELELDVSGGGSVRLMNLHKAKGLEAPIVILANPYKRVDVRDDRIDSHIVRTGEKPVGYFTFSRKSGHQSTKIAQPPRWDDHAAEEQMFLEAEKIRLLYVAATRARNLLVISTSAKDAEMTKNPWRELLQSYDADKIEPISLPEIIEPPAKAHGEAEEQLPVSCADLATLVETLHQWSRDVSRRGWSKITPSKLRAGRRGGEDFLQTVERGEAGIVPEAAPVAGGAPWGNVMHHALEALVKGEPDLEDLIGAALEGVGLPQTYLNTALQELIRFKETALWQGIQAAGENKHTEVPFSLNVNKGHYLHEMLKHDPDNHGPILVNGMIDLVYRSADGWVIVDYKTDQVNDEETLQHLICQYTPQLHLYAQAWQELTGETVARAELFFLTQKRSFPVYP